ncbi:uncharacterized protein OCT59_028531 [Rhizophagus irregularis]|uniref:Uncharacterized protein n=1 Tax=Rhizophagus irregularis TaxID=588596 RepID=A0A916E0H8_9GLOM|nr:hypothetical protein OCT59_028531 [Rhizophagus irregularis]GBC52927.2 hypothetical protein RIR_jg27773.t1 [Rhizophagus irregularis DAOM 181602=DAOM 197198]CAB4472947.1 unnamed protein product [Rhizophagus irregularis]CAB5342953.1 unnamed protein product [Rhizophagus irregularis]
MGSHHICLQSILASKKALQNVVFEKCVRKSIPSSLNFKLIDTEGFWILFLINVYHPAIVIAYYLDPRYHGQDLTDKYTFSMIAEETSKFVNRDLSGQLVKELLWYNNKTGPFNSSIFWKLEAIDNPTN